VTTSGNFEIVGRAKDPEHPVSTSVSAVSPNIFQTLGIPLLAGRLFQASDTSEAQMSIVVNQAFVHSYFPNEDPIGKQLKLGDKGPHQVATIVGVVGNTHAKSQAESAGPQIDFSYLQLTPQDPMTSNFLGFFSQIAVRTNGDPTTVMPSIRKVLREFDSDLSINEMQTMSELVESSMGKQTLAARLLWIFAGTALLISIAGIYGSLAYHVSQRTRDIGLRMAFGASRSEVVTMVLRQSTAMVCAGIAVGIIAALIVGRALSSFLFGVGAHDLFTIATVSLLLGLFALVASYVPARRASRIDPIKALRYE
jgi:predicted permease